MTDPFRAKPKPSNDDGPLDPTTGSLVGGGGALLGVAGPPPAPVDDAPVDDGHGSDGQVVDGEGDGRQDEGSADLEPLPSRAKLDGMRKADLRGLADSRGVTYDGDATKDELVDALEAAAGR